EEGRPRAPLVVGMEIDQRRAATGGEDLEGHGTAPDLDRASVGHLRSVPGARRPPAVLVAGPLVADVRHDFLREELGVLERQLLRHAADLQQDHQVPDPQALDAVGELLADRRGAARDDVALIDVLAPVERLARLARRGADLRARAALHGLHGAVAGRFREPFPDVQALLIEVVHVREVLALGLRVGLRHAHELQEAGAVRIVVGADARDRFPEAVHGRAAALVAKVGEVAIDVVELRRPLPRLDAAAARDPYGRMRFLEWLRPD